MEDILRPLFRIEDEQLYEELLDFETWVKMADTPRENAEMAKQLIIYSVDGDKTGEGVEWKEGMLRWTQRRIRVYGRPRSGK